LKKAAFLKERRFFGDRRFMRIVSLAERALGIRVGRMFKGRFGWSKADSPETLIKQVENFILIDNLRV